MSIIICPGIHDAKLTDRFIQGIPTQIKQDYFVLPTEKYLPYSAIAVYQWLERQQLAKTDPLSVIAFSAGVVGSFGAALTWQLRGGKICKFIAIDGWGMPLIANFPLYRISHDYFTHWSSGLLGAGQQGFYADPGVEHLAIWRSPEICCGWQVLSSGLKIRCSLNYFLEKTI